MGSAVSATRVARIVTQRAWRAGVDAVDAHCTLRSSAMAARADGGGGGPL